METAGESVAGLIQQFVCGRRDAAHLWRDLAGARAQRQQSRVPFRRALSSIYVIRRMASGLTGILGGESYVVDYRLPIQLQVGAGRNRIDGDIRSRRLTSFSNKNATVLDVATGTGKTRTALSICEILVLRGDIETATACSFSHRCHSARDVD